MSMKGERNLCKRILSHDLVDEVNEMPNGKCMLLRLSIPGKRRGMHDIRAA
jgi:hypothetical protein